MGLYRAKLEPMLRIFDNARSFFPTDMGLGRNGERQSFNSRGLEQSLGIHHGCDWLGSRPGQHLEVPYMTGIYGGGAFVLMFLVFIVLVGVPVMLAETLIGRRARQSPANALLQLASAAGRSPRWSWAAFAGMVTALLILSFYSVVGGWSLDYILGMGRGDFQG